MSPTILAGLGSDSGVKSDLDIFLKPRKEETESDKPDL